MEYRIITKRSSNNELYHYGVKGMKWGVRKDRDSKGTNVSVKRKVSSSSNTLFDDAITKGVTRNKYGWIDDLESTANIGSNKNVPIRLNVTKRGSSNDIADDIPQRAKKATEFIKKYKDDKTREDIANEYFDKNDPWINEDRSTPISRDMFKKCMKLDSISINPSYDMFVAAYYDGGTYGGHYFVVEGDMKTQKARRVSLEG